MTAPHTIPLSRSSPAEGTPSLGNGGEKSLAPFAIGNRVRNIKSDELATVVKFDLRSPWYPIGIQYDDDELERLYWADADGLELLSADLALTEVVSDPLQGLAA